MSPLKLFEYMAVSVPILCSDLQVFNNILKNDTNSILVNPSNLDDWSSKINFVKNNKKYGYNLARNANQDYLKNYTWHIRLKKILHINDTKI